ncbi:MAG: uroporphyrinogen-III synthase [Betaproteobacteria bacterium]|jgi:uroporphyrinogen-III synthase|nr:uroporphyrinogen-III synthase [Betaproteobacteria bacterium]
MGMQGKRVAVLESRLGRELADLVAGRGGEPFHAPALAELPDLDSAAIAALVGSLEARPAKLFVFQTGVGTRALFAATDSLSLSEKLNSLLKSMTVAVRGPKPTGALRQRGVHIDRSAADPYTTHELLECIKDLALKGERVIVQRYGSANRELDAALEARGAEVLEIPTYRWSLPQDTALLAELVGRLERGEMDAVLFTNAEQVRNLFLVSQKMNKDVKDALNRILVASIGPVASAALREAGVKVGVEASPPKLGALLSAVEGAL